MLLFHSDEKKTGWLQSVTQLVSFSAVIPNWKAGCYIKPKHQPHLKIPAPAVAQGRHLLFTQTVSKGNKKVRLTRSDQRSALL